MIRHRDESRWYDVMQACTNGHIITSQAVQRPEDQKRRCPKCGADTITQCPACDTNIQGHLHIPHVGYTGPTSLPEYCHECGAPYPWVKPDQHQAAENTTAPSPAMRGNDVFVVHGHDKEMKEDVARVLTKLGLNPIILHEQPNQGKTLIEKFEANSAVGFAVVLLSPDDMAYPKNSTANEAKGRARQNVILELGYFVGRLTRERVFTLKRGKSLELPSDINGVVYTSYDESDWRLQLVRELKACGYDVDANALV